ncbi:MAG: HEAT repeat domain-containing protein, partial [Okeania sp. SIO2H7]|nr:HEAT repeat domain-containing protein [Okeania sp. SIO2H7]
ETSVPVLLEILTSPEHPESTKGHAAWALAFIGTKAKEYLYREINSDSESVRAAVVGAIAKIAQDEGEERAIKILNDALGDSSAEVRCEAAAVLGTLAYQPAVPNLIELLHHRDAETRKAAALSLMKIRDFNALEPLQAACEAETEESIKPIMKLAISQLMAQS